MFDSWYLVGAALKTKVSQLVAREPNLTNRPFLFGLCSTLKYIKFHRVMVFIWSSNKYLWAVLVLCMAHQKKIIENSCLDSGCSSFGQAHHNVLQGVSVISFKISTKLNYKLSPYAPGRRFNMTRCIFNWAQARSQKYHVCTVHKHLIRNMTASMCCFDCKKRYKLSVFVIYLENWVCYPVKFRINLIYSLRTSTYKKINKIYWMLFSLECLMYRTCPHLSLNCIRN